MFLDGLMEMLGSEDSMLYDPLFLRGVFELFRLGFYTIVATVLLDLLCIKDLRRMLALDPSLYFQGFFFNIFNHFILAPLIFALPVKIALTYHGCLSPENAAPLEADKQRFLQSLNPFGSQKSLEFWLDPREASWCDEHVYPLEERSLGHWKTVLSCLGVLLAQSIGYYYGHKLMHKRGWYTLLSDID